MDSILNFQLFYSQSSKYDKVPTATSEKVKVTISAGVELKQTVSNVFEINFGKAMDLGLEGVTVEHVIKGVDAVSKDECLVRKVTMSEDKKTATVEMFYEFQDGEEYEVTVKGYDTETMIASNGVPVKAVLHADKDDVNGRQVVIGSDAPIYFKLYDANNVQVASGSDSSDLKEGNIEYKIKYANTDYETAGNMLFFTEAGDRAIVTLDYHTWNYDTETGVEKGAFTSSAFTFVGVNKADIAVKNIADYAVNAEYWRGANKNLVKMTDDSKWLAIKINLTDGKDRTINKPNFDIIAKDEETFIGTAKVVSLNEDVLEVYEGTRTENNATVPAIGLTPRKVGTALVKVSYIVNVNGVDVETVIGTVAIEVKGEPTMDKVSIWANSTTIATNPIEVEDPANGQNFRNKEYGFTVKDQYDVDYNAYKINKITGTTNLSKEALEAGAIAIVDNVVDNDKKIRLNDAEFGRVMANNNITNSGSFFFNIEIQDTVHYTTKTVTFSVYAKTVPYAENPKLNLMIEANTDALNKVGGNAARTWSNDDTPDTEAQKGATFTVYQMYNGAKVNEIKLTGRKPASVEGCTLGNYYWEVKKNGSVLTRQNPNYTDPDGDGTYTPEKDENGFPVTTTVDLNNVIGSDENPLGNGNSVIVNFSANKAYDGNTQGKQDVIGEDSTYVIYNNYYDIIAGNGTYEFVLWEVTENSKGENVFTRKLSKTVSATLDAGSYKFLTRDAVSVDVDLADDGTYNRNEMSKALLECFIIANRNGETYDKNADSWNNIIDHEKVNIGGNTKLYYVNFKDVDNRTVKTVYVSDITFWELIEDGVYAEYNVPVGYYVTVR